MCDTLCVRHTGGMWFAKNSDRHPDEVQIVRLFEPRVAGPELHTQYLTIPDSNAYAFCGSQPTWLWGCEHGVNQHGVAIGNEKIFTTTNPRDLPPALLGMDIVRLVLERAATADEALLVCTSLLERYGQGGSGEPHDDEPYFSSFLIADAHRGWVVETNNRTWATRSIDVGVAISNRVSLSTDWLRASPDVAPGTDFDTFREPRMPTGIADHRLAATAECVARPNVSARTIAATMRDHGNTFGELPGDIGEDWSGFTVCMHRREVPAQTTASMIVNLPLGDAPLRVWTCLGNPCLSVYVPAFPPAIAPELADPEQWKRFARLRDRVEAEPDEAREVRAVLAATEDLLWNAADAAVVSGDANARTWFARDAYHPVDQALRRLGV
jgi:secernin